MLRTEDPDLQEVFDKLSAVCKQRMKELLAPLEKEFDRAVMADGSIDLMASLLREGYRLQQLNRNVIMDVLLSLQFKIFPINSRVTLEAVDDSSASAHQRRFNAEVADCTDKLAAVTGSVMRQALAPVAINALFMLMKTHMVAALENGLITEQMARDYCQQLRGDLFPEDRPQSLN